PPRPAMLPLISLILGLSFLSGLNLYLASFLVSLAVQQNWAGEALHPMLGALGHPAFMITALVLFAVEFIIDKIPWVDSVWDAIHTLVRPAGAVGLSIALSHSAGFSPGLTTTLAVASFAIALTTHLTKCGFRLIINASPEPFTNILASLAEDAVVIGLAILLINAPTTGFAACLALLAGAWIALPRLLRLVRTSLFLLWKKFVGHPDSALHHHGALPAALTHAQSESILAQPDSADHIPARWAVPCITGKIRRLPGLRANRFGTLMSPLHQPGTLWFLNRGWFRRQATRISLAGATASHETSFLSTNLVIHRPDDGLHLVFRFTRAEAPLVVRLAADLQTLLGHQNPARMDVLPPPVPATAFPAPAQREFSTLAQNGIR
ncbi:MAG: hypothetical protein JWL81_2529, partial [Verrucomicrobiales bacterium]|nr:hypothetical protein [Verrucomicrobiales bacterium]